MDLTDASKRGAVDPAAVSRPMLIGWKTASLAFHLASVRYRALLPILQLHERGIESRIFSTGALHHLDDLDVLVIVKSYGVDDLYLASAASRRGIPVVLDLCDNIFIENYGNKGGVGYSRPSLHFDKIARLASTVVVTTSPLATIVRSRVGDHCRVVVVPDGIETPAAVQRMGELLAAADLAQRRGALALPRQRFASLRRKISILRSADIAPFIAHSASSAIRSIPARLRRRWLARSSLARPVAPVAKGAPRQEAEQVGPVGETRVRSILWFGHHGAEYAQFGMLDLLQIRRELEAAATGFDVELVVVSNSTTKFNKHIQPFAMRTRYVEWSSGSLLAELQRAAVVVIPNSLDEFSLCKSSNRAVLSLLNGVPVVATRTPALDGLSGCTILDDFDRGLSTYLADPTRAAADVERARVCIDALYGPQVIGEQWQRILENARPVAGESSEAPEFAVLIQSSLDWPLLRPVVTEALRRGEIVLAMVGADMGKGLSAISAELMDRGVTALPLTLQDARAFVFPQTIRVLLSASESSLYPHRLAHVLTERANAAGIFTATLQHGFETPGLTYHDALHSARKIAFASQRIYLWSPLSTLCAEVPASTVKRCVVVGCPDGASSLAQARGGEAVGDRMTVAIFENLHWHRYPTAYRQFFIDGLVAITRHFPQVRFTLRTHPAGRWLESPEARPLAGIKNLQLLKPDDPAVGDDGQDGLFRGVSAVISTPSSVVVHAARRGLIVGVVTGNLAASAMRYSPLSSIAAPEDWVNFVRSLQCEQQSSQLQRQSRAFYDVAIHPGDAAPRIVDDLCAQMEGG